MKNDVLTWLTRWSSRLTKLHVGRIARANVAPVVQQQVTEARDTATEKVQVPLSRLGKRIEEMTEPAKEST